LHALPLLRGFLGRFFGCELAQSCRRGFHIVVIAWGWQVSRWRHVENRPVKEPRSIITGTDHRRILPRLSPTRRRSSEGRR
jgi:hypothetical protein